jgi:hypothetical protein
MRRSNYLTDKLEFVNTAVPWFSFQREIVDRAVLSLKDAGVPFLFARRVIRR